MIVPNFQIEEKLKSHGKNLIVGMDEAGRGPLAGPLVCAGVIIDKYDSFDTPLIRDSKTLSEKQRGEAFKLINDNSLCIAYSFVDNKYIDSEGITNALKKAYLEILKDIQTYDHVLLDGNREYVDNKNVTTVIKGDSKSKTIAAASIVAKYLRDQYMIQSGRIFPEYDFHLHKGYGTAKHYEHIKMHGPSKLHRLTFLNSVIR